MNTKLVAVIWGIALCSTMLIGGYVAYRWYVPPLEIRVAELEALRVADQLAQARQTVSIMAADAAAMDKALAAREEVRADLYRAAHEAAEAMRAVQDDAGFDAALPAGVTDLLCRLYSQVSRSGDCAGGACDSSASGADGPQATARAPQGDDNAHTGGLDGAAAGLGR
ncbi:hypothetical protein LJC59_00215 [Desulfovibrio sp. OttesenSCG-928-A18]|nr:hypothetical protein [Desulfovibrio sp. OttesenSCG-928-A18]